MSKRAYDLCLTPHFKLSEFCVTEKDFNLDFVIPYPVFENIRRMASFLEMVRTYLDKPIYITSAYRPETLNLMVHGEKKSFHLVGSAVDICFNDSADYLRAWSFLSKLYKELDVNSPFYIAELLGTGHSCSWLHISLNCPQRDKKHVINSDYYSPF